MDEYINDMLHRYFKKLSMVGYANDDEVERLLGVIIINEFVRNDYRGFLDSRDRKIIERALYNLTGGCALPYPRINHRNIMNKLRLGDISELAGKVEMLAETATAFMENSKTKNKQQDERLDALEDFHDIEHPEYDEDDEKEYGAGRTPRDKGHVETKGCRAPECIDDRHRLVSMPLPPPPPPPYPECGCVKLSWR